MPYDSSKHHRRSIRLKGYDYSQPGAYFVTICVQHHECLFGEIVNGEMQRNAFGQIVQTCWENLPSHYAHVELDAFVVMPNHIHGIIVLSDTTVGAEVGAGLKPAPTSVRPSDTPTKRHGFPEIVRALKTFSARGINTLRNTEGVSVWQRNYYEHIIRNEHEWNAISNYIFNNPAQWLHDSDNPSQINHHPGLPSTQAYLRDAGL